MPKELALVTGGAGFIGSHIAESLLERGYEVRILDDFSTGKKAHIHLFESKVDLHQGSITDESALKKALSGVRYVFHQAAIRSVPKSVDQPNLSNNVNVTGTLNVLRLAKEAGVKMVVYASSSSLYGDGLVFPQHEELMPKPISPYAVSKLAGELYARVFAKSFGLPTISLRYFNVYGPRQDPESIYSAVIPRFMELAKEGRALEIHWDGRQSRDFTYIGDVVQANLLALKAPVKAYGEAFNVASGKSYSLLDLIRIIEKIIGRKLEKQFQPRRHGDVRKTSASIAKARRLLKFKPQMAFEAGLLATWRYFETDGEQAPAGGQLSAIH
ncbi:MAG: SDR family oxidoreductase [Elusimicrobia bacterium]|nr:SDR family oxidoreductase [Elusimicrobiota bacterium]